MNKKINNMMPNFKPIKFLVDKYTFIEIRDYEKDLYAITHFSEVLNKKGKWEYEPMPSSRTDDFIKRTRFTLDVAFKKAIKYCIAKHKETNEKNL